MSYKILYVLIFLTVSTNAHAEIIASGGDCGNNCSWTIDDKGVLTVSGTGDMKDYSDPEDWSHTYPTPWQSYKNVVKEIIIGEGITSIGTWAFKNFTTLENLTLADSVKKIGIIAFDSATALKKINIGENSQLEEIGWQAFAHDHALTSVFIPPLVQSLDVVFNDTNATIYCMKNMRKCRPDTHADVVYYTLENGIYTIGEGDDAKYYKSADLMLQNQDCNDQCLKAIALSQSGKPFVMNGKFYNSLSDWAKGNYIKKRIYTVDEAEMLSKPTGNSFRMRYK